MKSVTDLFFGLLRYVGLLEEHPLIRKNIKRNRVFDDFSSDDETPVLGKKFRWSDVEAIDNHVKARKPVRTLPVQTRSSISTPKESSKRTVPVDLPPLSRNGPSQRKTTSVTDGYVDLEEPKVAQVESKSDNTNKRAPIQHMDLDDDDDDNDEVVFVKEVATLPNEPLEPFQEKNSLPGVDDIDKTLSKILAAINSDDLPEYREPLQRIANTLQSMSKEKPVGDGKLAKNTASYRPSQKTQINNSDRHLNAPQERDPIRVSLTDSSDSDDDVEIVPASATTSSINTSSTRNFKELSRKWLLELNSMQQNNQEKVNYDEDARRASDITSKLNSDQNLAHSHGHDETDASEELLSKLATDYNIRDLYSKQTQINNAERHLNAAQERDPIRVSLTDSSDSDDDVEIVPASATTSSINTNSARNFKELTNKWLLELNSIYNNKQQNNQEKVNDDEDARRVSNITSKVNSDQNIAHSHGHDETDSSEELLSKLATDYNIKDLHSKPKIQKTQEKHNESRRPSDITPNERSGQNDAGSSNRETIGDWLARIDAKYFSTLLKTPDKLAVHEESNIVPKVSDQNEVQSYKPEVAERRDPLPSQKEPDAPQKDTVQKKTRASSLKSTNEWLKRLEAEHFSKTNENLSNACHETNIIPKVNGEQNDVRSNNLNTSGGLTLRTGSEYKTDFQKTQEKRDDARRESDNRPKANIEEIEARSYLPAALRDWLSQLDAKYKTTPQKNQENLDNARKRLKKVSEVNGEQSENRSLKPDSTDEWLTVLRSRYNEVQRKKQEELNDANRESSNENKLCSHKSDTTEEKLNNAHQQVNNLSKTNSTQNVARSLHFNTSEELLSKLGFLYSNYQQEKQENSNKAKDESAVKTQSNELPVLTPEQDDLVDRAFGPDPEDELLIEKFNMRIHRRDLLTLSDLNWLNDEIINFYMNLIMQRSEERKDLPNVYATNSFFYPKLMQSGQAGLRRWTRKVDIFAYDLFMVPVNIGHHWCLSIVDFRERVVKYLDSRGVPNQEYLNAVMKYLKNEHRDKKGALFNDRGWTMERVTGIPQQTNGSDCGMFACTFAEFSSRDAPYTFTQADMPYLRRKAALEIVMGKLLL